LYKLRERKKKKKEKKLEEISGTIPFRHDPSSGTVPPFVTLL
jgi:hypothetical protein